MFESYSLEPCPGVRLAVCPKAHKLSQSNSQGCHLAQKPWTKHTFGQIGLAKKCARRAERTFNAFGCEAEKDVA